MKNLNLSSSQKDVLATIQNLVYRLSNEKFRRKDRKILRQVVLNLSKEFKNFT